MPVKGENKDIATNRKAWHEYFVIEALEAGIELVGTEVKSLRAGGANLKEAWVDIMNGEMFILGMHISPYEKGNIFNTDPLRVRKLLVHKKQIEHFSQQVKSQGLTLIPLKLYFKGSKVKAEIGLCKGKKLYDKREDSARRDATRDIQRAVKDYNRR